MKALARVNSRIVARQVIESGKELNEVARAANIPRGALARYVRENAGVRLSTAKKLRAYFGDNAISYGVDYDAQDDNLNLKEALP